MLGAQVGSQSVFSHFGTAGATPMSRQKVKQSPRYLLWVQQQPSWLVWWRLTHTISFDMHSSPFKVRSWLFTNVTWLNRQSAYRHRFHERPIGPHSTKHAFRDNNRLESIIIEKLLTFWNCCFNIINGEYTQIMCSVWKYRFRTSQMYMLFNNRTVIYVHYWRFMKTEKRLARSFVLTALV